MPAAPAFAEDVAEAFRRAKILGIRAGSAHRYTAVWVVVVGNRPFIRSWSDKPTGWFRAFLAEAGGSVHLEGRDLPVRATVVRSQRVREAVTAAYAEKYSTKGSRKWVDGFRDPSRAKTTLEITPR
jgi:hypothetical protein